MDIDFAGLESIISHFPAGINLYVCIASSQFRNVRYLFIAELNECSLGYDHLPHGYVIHGTGSVKIIAGSNLLTRIISTVSLGCIEARLFQFVHQCIDSSSVDVIDFDLHIYTFVFILRHIISDLRQ